MLRDIAETFAPENMRAFVRNPAVKAYVRSAEYIAKFAAVVTVVYSALSYLSAGTQRDEARYRDAWQVLNLSYGHSGAGGRVSALQTLAAGGQALNGVNVRGAYLNGLSLDNASLSDADFSKASLASASFKNAVLDRASLTDADITRASFDGASLLGANLNRATIYAEDWERNQWKFLREPTVSFRDANLSYVTMAHSYLPFASFDEATIRDSEIKNANLRWGHFAKTVMMDDKFLGTNLSNAFFFQGGMVRVSFVNTCLANANFASVLFGSVDFSSSIVNGADFGGSQFDRESLLSLANAYGFETIQLKQSLRDIVRKSAHWHARSPNAKIIEARCRNAYQPRARPWKWHDVELDVGRH